MASDAELVARVRSGDVEAFGELAERYEKTLLAAVLAHSHDIHTAEDVVQAALLCAFRRLATLHDERKFGPWLIQIARRQLVEVVRARRVPASISLSGAEIERDAGGGIETWVENQHLVSLIARLPEHERILIGLRYFDGHSMAEIAAILARPIGTVTKQLSRAMIRLQTWCNRENQR